MATDNNITPALSQLLQSHRKIAELIRGALPGRVVNSLPEAAEEMLYDIANARATTWDEFGRKVQLLVDETTEERAHEGWLTAIQEGVHWDLKQLNGELAQAAE